MYMCALFRKLWQLPVLVYLKKYIHNFIYLHYVLKYTGNTVNVLHFARNSIQRFRWKEASAKSSTLLI